MAPCSLSLAPIKQMERGNEAASAAGTTWECSEHLGRKLSIFPSEPIKFTETHELSADLIKLKWGCLSEDSKYREGLGGGEKSKLWHKVRLPRKGCTLTKGRAQGRLLALDHLGFNL